MDKTNNLRTDQEPMVQPKAGSGEQSTLPASGVAPPMNADGWRAQLSPDSRQWMVNLIFETLKERVCDAPQEKLEELKRAVVVFEERTYSAATSQSEYLRRISKKMLKMGSKAKYPNI